MARLLSIAILFAVLVIGPETAVARQIMVRGDGLDSCGAWLENRKNDTYGDESQWVLGYVTEWNNDVWKSSDVAGNRDSDALIAWIDGYCSSHPLDDIAKASDSLIAALIAHGPP